MTQTLILTPRDRRSAAFFWLGVGVFPVFWSWFTMGKSFPKWQRCLALGWMLVVVAVLAITWPQMSERYSLMSPGLPALCVKLSHWLWVWLVLRVVPPGILVVMITPFAQLQSLYFPFISSLALPDVSIHWALLPLIPAILHLLLSPVRDALKMRPKVPAP